MAYVITNVEYLSLAGIPLSTPGWEMTEASDLWSTPDVRGDDVVMPGAVGVRAFPRRATVTKANIEVAVFGDVRWDGAHYVNARAGLAANCERLKTIVDPANRDAAGTVAAELHYAPGAPSPKRTGRLHVLRIRFARQAPQLATAQFELSIPAGALV